MFVNCFQCDGEGFVIVGTFHANDPGGRQARCEDCNGTGVVEIEGEPLDLEDIDVDDHG